MEMQEDKAATELQDFSVYLEQPKSLSESSVKKHCIYRAPQKVRQTKEASYTPRIVSIGPFYNGDERLKLMERLKFSYLKNFLEGTRLTIGHCFSKVKMWKQSILNCYAEDISLDGDDFLQMILTDAGFIIELFLTSKRLQRRRDHLFLKPWVAEDVLHDLILLENQLPFFVLDELFKLAPADYRGQITFLDLTFHYFADLNQQNIPSDGVSVQHFTDLIRIFYIPPKDRLPPRSGVDDILDHLYSANELVKAGLNLKVDKTKKCLLELQYYKGMLTMPRLDISDKIESHLRNIVAFEQHHYPCQTYITDYLKVLDIFISNKEDVEVLVRKGIITSLRDSREVATMIKHLCSNLVQPNMNEEYLAIFMQLNDFLEKPVNKWKASMKTISIAAVAILILTIVQTICSVISLFK